MFERCKPYRPPEDYLPLISSSFAILVPSILLSSTNPATVVTSVIKLFACITSSSPSTSLNNVSLPCGNDDGRLLQRLPGHQGAVLSVAWSPDGTRLASGSGNRGQGELFVWDA